MTIKKINKNTKLISFPPLPLRTLWVPIPMYLDCLEMINIFTYNFINANRIYVLLYNIITIYYIIKHFCFVSNFCNKDK